MLGFSICWGILVIYEIAEHFGVQPKKGIKKKHLNARCFAREFLRSCKCYGPGRSVKRHGKSSSLHSKKNFFVGGYRFFVSDVVSGGLLGHLGPLCLALGDNF